MGFTSPALQSAGRYPGYDRFGRVRKHAWIDGDLTTADGITPSKRGIVDLEYAYDRASNRTGKYNRLPILNQTDESEEYEYDGLDRLKVAKKGSGIAGVGGGFSMVAGANKWVLDQLGNWVERRTDLDGNYNGTTGFNDIAGELTETRMHNFANELTSRAIGGAAPALPFAYDKAGNLKGAAGAGGNAETAPDEKFTHDAWNRLVRVERKVGASLVTVLENQYNGLHWRVVKREDTQAADGDSTTAPDGLDRQVVMYYSASWQLLESRVNEDLGNTSAPAEDSRTQQFWGARYIDDAIMFRGKQRSDFESDAAYAAGAYGEPRYQITDAQFSVVVILEDQGLATPSVVERVRYSPYGEAVREAGVEFNSDGSLTPDDLGDFMNCYFGETGTPGTCLLADFNRDGNTDPDDLGDYINLYFVQTAAANSGNAEPGAISLIGNTIGYCGYVFNQTTTGMLVSSSGESGAAPTGGGLYTVRFRHYAAGIGRWIERDPEGTFAVIRVSDPFVKSEHRLASGMLLEYADSDPVQQTDMLGLSASVPAPSITIGCLNPRMALEAILTVTQNLSPAQRAAMLLALGITVGAVATLEPNVANIMRQLTDAARKTVKEAADRVREAIRRRKPDNDSRCNAARRMKDLMCKGPQGAETAGCGSMPVATFANCKAIAARAALWVSCCAAREAELMFCGKHMWADPSKTPEKNMENHMTSAINCAKAASECVAKARACKQVHQQVCCNVTTHTP